MFITNAAFELSDPPKGSSESAGDVIPQVRSGSLGGWPAAIVEASTDAILLLSAEGRIVFLNLAARQACAEQGFGNPVGLLWSDLWPPERRAEFADLFRSLSLGAAEVIQGEMADQRKAKRWWHCKVSLLEANGPEAPNILVVGRDITASKAAEARLTWAAYHDDLTGLPSRSKLLETLQSSTKDAELTGESFAFLILDVDNFKQINDTLGHAAGDALLREFSRRLVGALHSTDYVARLGGDEFAVILRSASNLGDVQSAADAIMRSLRKPFAFSDRLIDCQASIGASMWPDHGSSPSELMKAADLALYAAKDAGRGVLKTFDESYRVDCERRQSMISLARKAIDRGLIEAHYQPKISLRTKEIMGFEALLRLRNPAGQSQMPNEVEAAFHDQRIASAITDCMIGNVIRDILEWTRQGLPFHHVSINAAAAEFRTEGFAERLLEKLATSGVSVTSIQLEVTESVFLGRGAEYVENALKLLSKEGMLIALDDFGTGYASLSHLKQFPVDILKIDRSFVRDLHSDPEDGAIVAAIINLARSLNIRTVAEGVETPAQHNTLLALGCDFGQGFLYGHPQPVTATSCVLKSRHKIEGKGVATSSNEFLRSASKC